MNRIKQLRTEKGMRQTELAKILKIGQATMSNWETGRSEPDYDALIEMSEIFGTSIDYILGNSDIKSALT
ncbi:XRE family transcriptional regulator [Butyricicoccus sp. OF13-6]|nr:helix-turn-helix transcriptional regulator [Butyricicoccus sp. OF13-6]RHV77215.1 XRE family transcriptional regulator [Butyricicoccus sp. OF13-6]